jgi:flagellar biosynthesis chaperone FliJ
MSSYQPLETLLMVKRAAEDAAVQVLARATSRRAAAEATDLALVAELAEVRERLRGRRTAGASVDRESAASALEREHFCARLAAEVATHQARLLSHREGELASAGAAAATALTAHRVAREAREVVERLLAKAAETRRQVAARRDEMALDEQGQAAAAGRSPPDRGRS